MSAIGSGTSAVVLFECVVNDSVPMLCVSSLLSLQCSFPGGVDMPALEERRSDVCAGDPLPLPVFSSRFSIFAPRRATEVTFNRQASAAAISGKTRGGRVTRCRDA